MDFYILFSVTGFLFASVLYVFLIRREGVPLKLPLFSACCSVIGLFCGARLLGRISSWLYFKNSGEFIPEGFVFYGGLFGFLAVFLIMQKSAFGRISPVLCDTIAVTIPLFHGFGRIGCFFAECCYGSFLGIPVQLAESAFNFILFSVLLWLNLNNKLRGNLLGVYLVFYAAARFVLEFFREDSVRGMVGMLSLGQICSITAVFVVIKSFLKKINQGL